jgi:glutathione S-transferase
VIQHGGATIFEGAAITLYLTDAFPQAGLGPKVGDRDRGPYLSWLAYYTGVFEPSLTAKFLKIQHIYGTFAWGPFDEVLEHLERTLAARPYLLGDRFSAADIVYGGSMAFLISRGMVPDTEVFKGYAERVTSRPAHARARARDNG